MRQHDRRTVVGQVEFLRKTIVDGVPALIGEATFPDRPQSLDTLADIQAGLLNAVSIGFLAVQRGAPMHPTQRGSTYTKTTLLEVSVVALPACPTCVITGKGLTQCASCSTPGDDVDVLAGITLPTQQDDEPDVLELDDESEHVFQSPAVIRRLIRDTVREGLRETVQRSIKKELNRLRGRLD